MLWSDVRGWSFYGISCPVNHALNFTSVGVKSCKVNKQINVPVLCSSGKDLDIKHIMCLTFSMPFCVLVCA